MSYDLKSFSSFVGSLLLKQCGCLSPYNIQSEALSIKLSPLHGNWTLSLALLYFVAGLLSIKKCTLSSCTFHFFKPVFVISWSSLWQTNFIPSTVRPVSFAVAVNFRLSHRFQFGFARVAFPFYYSSSLQLFGLFFIHSNTVKSCFQAYVLSSPKILYFSSKKKEAVMPFQVWFRDHKLL